MARFKSLFLICILSTSFLFNPFALEKRDPFPIPLPHLFVRFDGRTGCLDEVFIAYNSEKEGWAIAKFDDRYTKSTNKRQTDHIFKEHDNIAYLLSDFEAQQLNKICESFVYTLILFDRYLQRQRWDRLRYLDGYLPAFFQGFYYVMHAAHCGKNCLPPVTCIADSLFDKSVNSLKSDIRIQHWSKNPAYITKLRIVTKELIFQTCQWQEKELINPERNGYLYTNNKFKEIYELFIRLYFNLDYSGKLIITEYSEQTLKKSTP